MDKKVFDLHTAMEGISFCDLERARTACEELLEGYFAKENPEPCMQAAYYHKYATMASIVFDYIVQAQQKLDVARKEAEA